MEKIDLDYDFDILEGKVFFDWKLNKLIMNFIGFDIILELDIEFLDGKIIIVNDSNF